jgi:hypothetical protein
MTMKRFDLFVLVVWYPALFIGGVVLSDYYATDIRQWHIGLRAFAVYLYIVLFLAPIIWQSFRRKD